MIRAIVGQSLALERAQIVDSLSLQVRWRRKPRWLGTAKSKLFRVPERPKQDEEERAWLFKEFHNYRTEVKAIRSFLIKEVQKELEKVSVLHKSAEQIQAEWDAAIAKNDAWNAECAKVRAVRLEKEAAEKREYVLQKLAEKEERKEEMKNKIREAVLKEKSQVDTFITEENLDQAIEYALANPVDYNFAIDLEGNIYRGKLTQQEAPHQTSEKK